MNNLPKTWEKFWKQNNKNFDWRLLDIDEKYVCQFKALHQLILLRDCYRQGWVPDEDTFILYCTSNSQGEIIIHEAMNTTNSILSFQSRELRNEFLDNFEDLIEQAKELI